MIQEYRVEPDLQGAMYTDIANRLNGDGDDLPRDYDHQSGLNQNDFSLYEQKALRETERDKRKIIDYLTMGAVSIEAVCSGMNLAFPKTKKLPSKLKKSIENHEFDDLLDSLGQKIHGTVMADPVVSMGIRFMKTIAEAHDEQSKEEQEQLEDNEEDRKTHTDQAYRNYNQFRRQATTGRPDQASSLSEAYRNLSTNVAAPSNGPAARLSDSIPPPPDIGEEEEEKEVRRTPRARPVVHREPVRRQETPPTPKRAAVAVTAPQKKEEEEKKKKEEEAVDEADETAEMQDEKKTLTKTSVARDPPKKSKGRGFAKVDDFTIPPEMKSMLDKLKAPMEQVDDMMKRDEEDQAEDERTRRAMESAISLH